MTSLFSIILFLCFLLCVPVYADTAVYSSPISKDIRSIRNPYSAKANVYKGQLHFHSTNSDGLDTPAAIVTAYRDAGYDFVCLTDHDVLTPDPSVSGILFIPGVEETVTSRHSGHINASSQYSTIDAQIYLNSLESDAIASICHPNSAGGADWPILTILGLNGYWSIELLNGAIGDNANGNSENIADQILNNGIHICLTAVDDCHDIGAGSFNSGWIVLNSDTLTISDILSSLKNCNFYSSNGADMNISVVGNGITVSTSDSSTINFIGNGGVVFQTNASVTSATYNVQGYEKYVRARITRDSDSKKAWSNPFWIGGN